MTDPTQDPASPDFPSRLGDANVAALKIEDLPPDMAELAAKPGRVLCGDIDMRIDSNGTWFYMGSPIGRKELVKLFSTVLRLDSEGNYWLITPAEMARIKVEDAPFTALELMTETVDGEPVLKFRTNVDAIITLDDDHPLRIEHDLETNEPRPYIHVRDGLDALIVRSVFYQLIEEGVSLDMDEQEILGVWSNECFFPIGPTE